MKTQQQAEREEQQRIKNLVLNYDLRESEDQDGNDYPKPLKAHPDIHKPQAGHEKPTSYHHNRTDRGKDRGGQRVRKLQLSDVDWYESSTKRGNYFARAHTSHSDWDVEAGNDVEQSEIAPVQHHGTVHKRHMSAMHSTPRPGDRKEQPRRVRKCQ